MSSFIKRSVLAGAVMLTCAATHGRYHAPKNIPADPVAVETFSLGLDGPCAGLGWHNPDEARAVVFGIDDSGLVAQPAAYDFMRQWADGEACAPSDVSAELGVQYGPRMSNDAVNEYAGAGYRVTVGDGLQLRLLGGVVFEGWNSHLRKTPMTVNVFNLYPFVTVELGGVW